MKRRPLRSAVDFGMFMADALMAAHPSLLVFMTLRRQVIRGFTLACAGWKG